MSSEHKTQYRKDYKKPDYTIEKVDLEFHLDDKETQVIAVSQVLRLSADTFSPLVLDGEQLSLLYIEIDGRVVENYELTDSQLIIPDVPQSFTLTIASEISPVDNTALEGLYKSQGAYCTQCEAQGFRRITWFLDRPDVLAKYTTKIIADKKAYPYLLSNGNEIGRGDIAGGLHWVQWQDPFPKPSYLFALVAGQFDLLEDSFITRSGREVALQLFVEPGNSSKGQHALDSLKKSMAWDEQRFDLEYDLDIYMIVAVDFFNMGAMENKGLNVFNAKYVLADASTATDQDYLNIEAVIGHEYFHNWTGNRVTCRDWFQLSLKEGLTVFRDQEFSSDLGSRTVNRIQNVRTIRGPQFAEDASPMAHPIRPDAVMEMNNFYTVTVYNKGSEVIRMMHTLLGEKDFIKANTHYLQRFDGQAATCEDYVQAMEYVSGRDLQQFRLWYSTAGTPLVKVTEEFDAQAKTYQLHFVQDEKLPAMHIPIDIELIEVGESASSTQSLFELTGAQQTLSFDNVAVKPVAALLRGFSAPIRLEFEQSEGELTTIIAHANDQFVRWDAAQHLYLSAIDSAIQTGESAVLSDLAVASLSQAMQSESDPYFLSVLLSVPSESELAQNYQQVDVEAIHKARSELVEFIAQALQPLFAQAYASKTQQAYAFEQKAIGQRALANCALTYLAKEQGELVQEQFAKADNMTDSLAALHAANVHELPCLSELMSDFEQRWKDDALVMDKWLMLQATRPSVRADEIKELMQHSAFSMSNPNRVRSLIGSFVSSNPNAFHDISGSGYKLLKEVIAELNSINPQVAARIIDPLLRFKRYDSQRQQLMKNELEDLSAIEGLSRDLFEKISKALA